MNSTVIFVIICSVDVILAAFCLVWFMRFRKKK